MFGRQPNYKPEVSGYARNLQDTLKQVQEHAREHRRATQKRHKLTFLFIFDQGLARDEKVGEKRELDDL